MDSGSPKRPWKTKKTKKQIAKEIYKAITKAINEIHRSGEGTSVNGGYILVDR